jgi:hypothetical protein
VMHPHLDYVYITMVREEWERQAEHQRLVALTRRLRRQRRCCMGTSPRAAAQAVNLNEAPLSSNY